MEAVIDSSRYFVLRVRDPGSGRVASLGVGFRERADASAFAASLHGLAAARRRATEAAAARAAYQATMAERGEGGWAPGGLRPGETLTLKPVRQGLAGEVDGACLCVQRPGLPDAFARPSSQVVSPAAAAVGETVYQSKRRVWLNP